MISPLGMPVHLRFGIPVFVLRKVMSRKQKKRQQIKHCAQDVSTCSISHAAKMIDDGKHDNAAKLCNAILRRDSKNCDAWYLSEPVGRVDLGGCPPRSPTDPGLHITRTRFLIS